MKNIAIVIPCYNEANRLPVADYSCFLKRKLPVKLLFVNDGSTDNTHAVLEQLRSLYPDQVLCLDLFKNSGKAAAVRKGMQHLLSGSFQKYAYLDADLSTTLNECLSLAEKVSENVPFVFGSRILKIDNQIQRKWHRFLIGRIVASLISKMLGIKVYDTQCGCKIFDARTAADLFASPFSSKWLFDVELFFRMIKKVGKDRIQDATLEVPLQQWIDTSDSRVSWSYGFVLWIDLIKIYLRYR